MLFQDIPGLESTKRHLTKSVQNQHVAHAQLFHGPAGGAQLAMALAFISYLFCQNKNESDACGTCPSCQKVRKGIHPDVVYLFPSATNKKITKDPESDLFLPEWRQFILESPYRTIADWLTFIGVEGLKQGNIPVLDIRKLASKTSIKPFEAPFRVVLIWNSELLHPSSGNALLKNLEEPPPGTLYILVCSDTSKLLITILSRTQRINIPSVEAEQMANFLVKQQSIEQEKALQIAWNTEGNISLAIDKAKNENLTMSTWFSEWMRAVYSKNLTKLVSLADKFDALAKNDQKALLIHGLYIFRQCVYQITGAQQLIKSLDQEKAFIANFAKTLSPEIIGMMSEKMSAVHYHLERNGRAKILHLDLSLNLIKIFSSAKKLQTNAKN